MDEDLKLDSDVIYSLYINLDILFKFYEKKTILPVYLNTYH